MFDQPVLAALSRKLLIVDDEPVVRRSIREALMLEGFEVEEAENGQVGLDKVVSWNPTVVILDLRMPVMDGTQFLENLPATGRTPAVVVLTGHGNDDDVEDCFDLGARFFLRKPFSFNEVIGVVKSVSTIRENHLRVEQVNHDLQRALEEAQVANRAKDAFLATMSHEIRTPLNAVIGMADLLMGMSLDGMSREYVEIIRSSSSSLLTIINDILDFSRMNAGHLKLERMPFAASEMLELPVKTLAIQAHAKGIELFMDSTLPDVLECDARRLRQVMLNLVGNAVKFTEHGHVLVRIAVEKGEDGQDWLGIVVSDTGIGIPKDRLAHIFDAFTQVDETVARRFGGSGLGLAIANGIATLMGGRMGVESEEGVGSRFTLHVPVGVVDDASLHEGALQMPRTLLISDHELGSTLMQALLQRCGAQVDVAANAAAGVAQYAAAIAAQQPYGAVIADIYESSGAGLELARHLMEAAVQHGALPVPVMLLSDTDHGLSDLELKQVGVSHMLVRPPIPSEIGRMLAEIQAAEMQGDAFVAKDVTVFEKESAEMNASLRVLVAEDISTNRQVLKAILAKIGHDCEFAEDGQQAVDAWKRNTYDLILMDISMPVLDGVEAMLEIRRLEKDSGKPHTPVVAVTAHALEGDREHYLQWGMDGYVSKPVQMAVLRAEIERVLNAAAEA